MSLLEAIDVGCTRIVGERAVEILRPLSFTLAAGDFKVVVGPSGSGKSTLLQLLSGLEGPSTGTIKFRERDIYAMPDAQLSRLRNESFGFVFQTPHMLAHKTVLANVLLPAGYAAGRPALRARALELLRYVGLEEFESRRVNTLSGGELQRVGFARALLMDPDIVFADEPTGALDLATSTVILDLLQDQGEKGRAIVMATHDPHAMDYGTDHLALEKL